jgi:hypothetical protein
MTIAQMFTRMTRPLSKKVPASMTSEEQQWLVDALNLALIQFTDKLPDIRKVETRTARLVAPVTKSITATAESATIAFAAPWAEVVANLGRTVIVGSDAARFNRLASATTLQHAHEGASGSTTLQVLSDAVLIGQNEDGLDGEVFLQDGDDMQMLTHGLPKGLWENDVMRVQLGRPTHWWIEPLNGISAGATPVFLIRLWPQPGTLYQLRYSERLWPSAVTTSSIASTTELPLKVQEESLFLSLAIRGLTACPLWQGTANKDDAQQDYDRSMSILAGGQSNQGHTQSGLCRTKKGF